MEQIPPFLKQVMAIMAKVAHDIPMRAYKGEKDIPVIFKSDGTPVTDADRATEYKLIEELTRLLPHSHVMGEETVGEKDAWKASPLLTSTGDVWIVDPIDGTFYFYRKQSFGMLIGLRQEGEMQMAIAYYPVEQEYVWAKRGTEGAFHCTIKDSEISDPQHIAMPKQDIRATELGYYIGPGDARKVEEILDPLCVTQFAGTQSSLSVAIAIRRMLLKGGYACLYANYKPWDFETTALIMRQAGADVTHFDGSQSRTTPGAHNVIFAPTRDISQMIHDGIRRKGLMSTPSLPPTAQP